MYKHNFKKTEGKDGKEKTHRWTAVPKKEGQLGILVHTHSATQLPVLRKSD